MEGLSPIPWTAMVMWFDRHPQFMPEDLDGFVAIIRRLDEEYRKWAEKNKPKDKPIGGDKRPPARPKKRRVKKVHG